MQPWRLIPLIHASGAVQMALDEWLLEQHRTGQMPSTLRFYTWSPIAISLGYHQHRYPDAWSQLRWQGYPVDLVRRPSGGRAVLHQGDLTYAVITSGLKGDRAQVYRTLCQFLIDGLRTLNLDLQYGMAHRNYMHNPNCFGTATAADLVLPNGVKLIGSAQLRRGGAILQHGSIRLTPDPDLFHQVFGGANLVAPSSAIKPQTLQSNPEQSNPGQPSTGQANAGEPNARQSNARQSNAGRFQISSSTSCSLAPQLPEQPDYEMVMSVLVEAACRCFNMTYQLEPLSQTEWNTVLAQSHKWHKRHQRE